MTTSSNAFFEEITQKLLGMYWSYSGSVAVSYWSGRDSIKLLFPLNTVYAKWQLKSYQVQKGKIYFQKGSDKYTKYATSWWKSLQGEVGEQLFCSKKPTKQKRNDGCLPSYHEPRIRKREVLICTVQTHHQSQSLCIWMENKFSFVEHFLIKNSHTHAYAHIHTWMNTSMHIFFSLWAKIKTIPIEREKIACWSGGSWKESACFVFHQSALNQRVHNVLEFWDIATKRRRDGMNERERWGE